MPRLLIIATEDAQAGFRLASSSPGVRCVLPESLLVTGASRDIAASFFAPLADVLSAEPPSSEILALPRLWPSTLPVAHRRMLERTALALGAVLVPLSSALGPEKASLQAPLLARPGQNPSQGPILTVGRPYSWAPSGGLSSGWANLGPGAGAFRPGVSTLLVGERPGVARTGELKHRLPFVTFAGTGCAPWLAHQLESIGVGKEQLYWINAYDALNVPTEHVFLELLQPRIIVALGKLAARWCSDASTRYEETTHPQFWKRFHHRERYPLLDLLGDGA